MSNTYSYVMKFDIRAVGKDYQDVEYYERLCLALKRLGYYGHVLETSGEHRRFIYIATDVNSSTHVIWGRDESMFKTVSCFEYILSPDGTIIPGKRQKGSDFPKTPQNGTTYWVGGIAGKPKSFMWIGSDLDTYFYENGLVFRTPDGAQKYVDGLIRQGVGKQ